SSSAARMVGDPYMGGAKSSRRIRTGAISSYSTSTSTATTGPASARATRPDGPAPSPEPCICSPRPPPSRPSRSARRPPSWKRTRLRRSPPRAQPQRAKADMDEPLYPSLYQVNTRIWLTELSRPLGRLAKLDDIPDSELARIASMGFDWVWFLSLWRTGPAGQRVSRNNQEWRKEFEQTLPDLKEEDIAGSGFAITGYAVHPTLGGDAALVRLRERLRSRGLRLMLDFVPNHTALDHPWVENHSDYYIAGTEIDLAREPRNYTRVKRAAGELLLAHGRDPYFPGWPDTLQLDYSNPATQ